MALDRDLHDLLFLHDCVIVPGFGGFLTHYRPARLDVQRNLVHPPSKDLSFNRHLIRQDGLLVDRLMHRENLEFQQAKEAVDQEVAQWQRTLDQAGRLELTRVGTFFRDAERNLQFEPDRRVNFLKDSYGLGPVAAVPVPEGRLSVKPVVEDVALVASERREGFGFLAAAAVAAIAFTVAAWWAVGGGGQGIALGGFDLLKGTEPARYVLPQSPTALEWPAQASIWSVPAEGSGIQALPIAGPDVAPVAVDLGQAPAKAEPESTAVATRNVGPRFHIIGGCFLEKENADRFVAELQAKGFAATLVDRKGGLYRVAYGSYPLRSTALEALNAVRKEEAPQAWLLVK